MKYRPRARPDVFFYYGGYAFVASGFIGIGLGLVRVDWISIAYGIALLVFGTLYLSFFAWWREVYDQNHPDDVDAGITWLERFSDDASLRVVRRVGRLFAKHA